MPTLESLKDDLEDIENKIDSLEIERSQLEDKIEKWREAEKLEPFVLAALNKNYNRWCSREYLEKTIRWEETDLENDDWRDYRAILSCEVLFEKGIIQRKEVGRDWENDPIYDYRITDTETIDMFDRR